MQYKLYSEEFLTALGEYARLRAAAPASSATSTPGTTGDGGTTATTPSS
jgi:hypothetical protein